jgi:hypothetical protein
MAKKEICKNCKFWKSEQGEMRFSKFVGFCTNPILVLGSSNENGATILDIENRNLENWHGVNKFRAISDVAPYSVFNIRYSLVTGTEFGCVNFSKNGD